MDIKIPDKWLREYLRTKASPREIAKYLSLCGPSVEKEEKTKTDTIYSIEVTTNRVDSASVFGIAREAGAILPRFGIKSSLQPIKVHAGQTFSKNVGYLSARVDPKLCFRFSAILIKNAAIKDSPDWLKERLSALGNSPINNVVDISNYIMHEIGQPVHTFDYDKIEGHRMVLRASRKGERITTLDGKTFDLPGGDIVIQDGSGRLIDLAGIMGGENSMIEGNTKNVLLFVQTYNPVNIRRTSMALAQRTDAAVLFEKGLDPQLVEAGIKRGIDLFVKLTGGTPAGKILDIYPNPYKKHEVATSLDFINLRLGTSLSLGDIQKILKPLGFGVSQDGKNIKVGVPSFRADDVNIEEDVVEEVARIYGYHNLKSTLMEGPIPEPLPNTPFDFEKKVKNILKGYGGTEIYTSSLVPREYVTETALKLKNPLGKESEYLRTSLMPSLLEAAGQNLATKEPFCLFEMANVYLPLRGNLPQEKMILAGIFSDCAFREAKGNIEALLEEMRCPYSFRPEDEKGFLPSQSLNIYSGKELIGRLGTSSRNEKLIYYDFDMEKLKKVSRGFPAYKPIPKFPPQIEDLTFSFPPKTKLGEVLEQIKKSDSLISEGQLVDTYKDFYTVRVWYQHLTKTLTDKEVEKIRNKLIQNMEKKFGGRFKA